MLLAEREQVIKLERKLRQERNAEKKKTDQLQEQIARLEAMLDATPVEVAKPEVVTIPASRPIPADAQVCHAYVFGGRVHLIDPFTPVDLFEREFRLNRRHRLAERINRPGDDLYRDDADKIVKHFKDFDWRNGRGQKIELISQPHRGHLTIRITPDPSKGGTTTEELDRAGSGFHQAMQSLRRSLRGVLMFRVRPDFFDTYLAARRVADAMKIPAGWEVYSRTSHDHRIPDLAIKPKAKPPEPKGGKPEGPEPPNLKPTLD